MKLIIDIPEDVYTRLFDNGIQDNEIAIDDICEMARALRLGTPLDDLRAEIEQLHHHPKLDFIENDEVVDIAVEIIDKYIANNKDMQWKMENCCCMEDDRK